MEIGALQSNVPATTVPLDRLANNPQLSEEQKVAEVSRQFEAVLLRQILAQAQKTVIKSDFTQDNAVTGVYQDMITSQLADSISRAGTLGLARNLNQQLTHQLTTK